MDELYNNYREVTKDNLKRYLDRYVRAGKLSGDTRDGYVALFADKFGGQAARQYDFEKFVKELGYRDQAHHVTKGDANRIAGLIAEA